MGQPPDMTAGPAGRRSSQASGADRAAPGERQGKAMSGQAVISLTTGLEDPEKVTVAFLVALVAQDSAGLRATLADEIGFQARTPGAHWQAAAGPRWPTESCSAGAPQPR
jgi:hypothetical protein